jgi:hypothetical protein
MSVTANLRTRNPAGPGEIQSFAKAEDRDRLSSTWERIKRGNWEQPLSQDQLTRASAAIGLYKGLKLLFADDMAVKWPKLPNAGPIFGRLSPVDAMIEGGIPAMLEVRRHVDAVRGGL